jgi:hypothetical protein
MKLSPTFLIATLAVATWSAVPGTLSTDWVGNTYGFGDLVDSSASASIDLNRTWVQTYVANAWIDPTGRVFAYSNWDEGNRAAGIYKDGKVLGQLVYGKDVFGLDGDIVGDSKYEYATSYVDWGNWERHGFGIQRFDRKGNLAGWTGGRGISGSYLVLRDSGNNPPTSRLAIDTSARELYLWDSAAGGTIYVYDLATMSQTPKASWKMSKVAYMTTDHAGSIWAIQGTTIRKYSNRGILQTTTITSIAAPQRLSYDGLRKRLLVFDDSTLQVHMFTSLGTTPVDSAQFGALGGIYSGTKGEVKPEKLLPKCASVGADSAGNLYLSWGGVAPVAGTDIRSFSPAGALRWQLIGHTFVACGGFDPATDGQDIYYRDHHYTLDYTKPLGKKWSYNSFLWNRAVDTPKVFGGSVIVRHLAGKTVLASTKTDQMSGGFLFYTMDQQTAAPAGSIYNGDWAWWIEPNGNTWSINGAKQVVCTKFLGIGSNGKLQYDTAHPDVFSMQKTIPDIQRIKYDSASDALYATGYDSARPRLNGEWGRTGSVMVKFAGWRRGARTVAWKIALPRDNPLNGDTSGTLKDAFFEGDYAFLVTCNSTPATTIYVFSLTDGSLVGTIVPGSEIGGNISFMGSMGGLGWVDMAWGIQAYKRKSGQYAILLEDDVHAKNVMYLWCPTGTCTENTVQNTTSTQARPVAESAKRDNGVDPRAGTIALKGRYRLDGRTIPVQDR